MTLIKCKHKKLTYFDLSPVKLVKNDGMYLDVMLVFCTGKSLQAIFNWAKVNCRCPSPSIPAHLPNADAQTFYMMKL
jgi:hypothetical protein